MKTYHFWRSNKKLFSIDSWAPLSFYFITKMVRVRILGKKTGAMCIYVLTGRNFYDTGRMGNISAGKGGFLWKELFWEVRIYYQNMHRTSPVIDILLLLFFFLHYLPGKVMVYIKFHNPRCYSYFLWYYDRQAALCVLRQIAVFLWTTWNTVMVWNSHIETHPLASVTGLHLSCTAWIPSYICKNLYRFKQR